MGAVGRTRCGRCGAGVVRMVAWRTGRSIPNPFVGNSRPGRRRLGVFTMIVSRVAARVTPPRTRARSGLPGGPRETNWRQAATAKLDTDCCMHPTPTPSESPALNGFQPTCIILSTSRPRLTAACQARHAALDSVRHTCEGQQGAARFSCVTAVALTAGSTWEKLAIGNRVDAPSRRGSRCPQ